MKTLGYDIGSSSIKATLFDVEKGEAITQTMYPDDEMRIYSVKPGWAEQDEETWWESVVILTKRLLKNSKTRVEEIKSIQ